MDTGQLNTFSPETMVDPLADLVRQAARGDRIATERLLRATAPRLLSAIRSVLGAQHPDVEDVLQESMVALVNAIPTFEGRSSFLHYAARIAVRVSLSAQRAKYRRDGRVSLREELDDLVHPDGVVEHPARRRLLLRQLLTELPSNQAETVVMRLCLGLSLDEVADLTQAPVNTVRSRLRLARESIRRKLDTELGRVAHGGGQ